MIKKWDIILIAALLAASFIPEGVFLLGGNSADKGGTYAVMSGTSVAAPYVAGACCLLHERYAALTPREAKRMIVASSRVVDGARVFKL